MEKVEMRGNKRHAVTTKQTELTLALVMMTPPKGLKKDKKQSRNTSKERLKGSAKAPPGSWVKGKKHTHSHTIMHTSAALA